MTKNQKKSWAKLEVITQKPGFVRVLAKAKQEKAQRAKEHKKKEKTKKKIARKSKRKNRK